MILTKKYLEEYLNTRRINIPKNLFNKILSNFNHLISDEAGHMMEYSEQDVIEQVRKMIQNFQNGGKLAGNF